VFAVLSSVIENDMCATDDALSILYTPNLFTLSDGYIINELGKEDESRMNGPTFPLTINNKGVPEGGAGKNVVFRSPLAVVAGLIILS
jgi:hypothetical protein